MREAVDRREGLDHRLRPAEVRQPRHDFSVPHEEGAVARGAGHERRLRLEEAVDVVEARDPDAELRGADELLARGLAAGHGAVVDGAMLAAAEAPAVRGRREAEAVGVHLVDDRRAHDAVLDQHDAALRQPLEVEREGEEGGVDGVVGEGEVRAEELLADVVDEERRAVLERLPAEGDHVHPLEDFGGRGRLEHALRRGHVHGGGRPAAWSPCCFRRCHRRAHALEPVVGAGAGGAALGDGRQPVELAGQPILRPDQALEGHRAGDPSHLALWPDLVSLIQPYTDPVSRPGMVRR